MADARAFPKIPLTGLRPMNPATEKVVLRFLGKTRRLDDGCLLWTSPPNNGYGMFQPNTLTTKRAHVWYWEQTYGVYLPSGHNLHHLCGERMCVEPTHLFLMTAADHCRLHGLRGMGATHAAKTHCDSGHEFTDENTYIDKTGARKCRSCRADAARRLRARKVSA